ncbi:cell wall-binding repeat-containing protein [Desulfosporosinus meridiei]|uniref:Cell wall-binding protein n=1 Tax=Desulfosporosinus meridiei (strain ATCC BAA-275 / DSM 13257 / KCTC 12902 / NCIMB 13706 / S10) TaxID=768704 RepID=J7J0L7_DESMD|nr:cell wall-binding repeat-containing protein [Desulfosporosinus meridiei]AFQ45904.1 cell wall-binding protein [Desulfosporosinus meridiei DSM 13257]
MIRTQRKFCFLNPTKKNFILSLFLMSLFLFTCPLIASASAYTVRIAGYDKYQTAAAISQQGWPNGADAAILAYGEDYPDALSAGPLAHKYNAPILLTDSYTLNSDTAAELKRLKVKKVYIIGGQAVISNEVQKQLTAMKIPTERLAGQDRYETSLLVAQAVGLSKGAFVTTGMNYPDALSIGPIAAANEMPILLVPPTELTPTQKDFLAKTKISSAVIVAGYYDLSDNVLNQFPEYELISGYDAYDRNIKLIKRFSGDLNLDTVYVSTGGSFSDGLAASALAQKEKNPIILLQGNTIPYTTLPFIQSKLISKFFILGGTGVISSSTESTLAELPAEIESVADVTDSIIEQQKYEPPKTVTATKSDGSTEEVPVTWTLSSVQTLKSGTYRFEGRVKNYSDSVFLKLTIYPKASKAENITAEIILGESYDFPETVEVAMSDGSSETYPVTWNTKIVPLNKAGSYSFQGTIEGLTQKITLTLKVSEDAKITFTDSELHSAVRRKLHKSSSESIYKSDVLDITSLNFRNDDITDLTGLEYFVNLKTLDVGNNQLTKIAALGKLKNLRTLKLNDNGLKDVSALKTLTSLTYLDISDNYITNFTPLKGLTQLTTLYLDDNEPFDDVDGYTPDYSPIRAYYDNLDKKDFSL